MTFKPNTAPRQMRNAMLRKYGSGDVSDMTDEQFTARRAFLKARGRTGEAVELAKAWLRRGPNKR